MPGRMMIIGEEDLPEQIEFLVAKPQDAFPVQGCITGIEGVAGVPGGEDDPLVKPYGLMEIGRAHV